MPRNSIDLAFADGEYTFALPLAQIAELQRKTDCGIGALYARVFKGCGIAPGSKDVILLPSQAEFYALDLIETIRQGLIGGGKGLVDGEEIKVTPVLANRLIEGYVLCQPLGDAWNIAASILGATILGYDPPKKAAPAAARAAPRKRQAKADSTTEKP